MLQFPGQTSRGDRSVQPLTDPLIHLPVSNPHFSSIQNSAQSFPFSDMHSALSFPTHSSSLSPLLFPAYIIHQSSHFLVPHSLFCPLFTHNFYDSLTLRPRESLSLDSGASLSLSSVARDICVHSTNYCSSYEPHL